MPWRNPEFLQWIPFIGLAVKSPGAQHPLVIRLLEAAIIGAVVTWGTVQVLSNDIRWIRDSIAQQNQRIDRLESHLLAPRRAP
jgi:hypothetical protein